MPVPSSIADLSTTATNNYPTGGESPGVVDNHIRSLGAIVKQNVSKGTNIASASTITIPNDGYYFTVTGTTTISAIANAWTGRMVVLNFSDILTLTHSAGLILPGSQNITTFAGATYILTNESTGVWRMIAYSDAVNAPNKDGTGAFGTWSIAVTGNAGTVTNGVYTTGDQTIGGVKTFSSTIQGNVSGSSGSCTGNSATATNASQLGGVAAASYALTANAATDHNHSGVYLPITNGDNIGSLAVAIAASDPSWYADSNYAGSLLSSRFGFTATGSWKCLSVCTWNAWADQWCGLFRRIS